MVETILNGADLKFNLEKLNFDNLVVNSRRGRINYKDVAEPKSDFLNFAPYQKSSKSK